MSNLPGELKNWIAPRRQLTVVSRSGLCNRLKVFLSGLAIAKATERAFAMQWSVRASSFSFDRLFQNRWDVRAHIPIDEGRLIDLTVYQWRAFPDLLIATDDTLVVSHFDWLIQPTRYLTHLPLQNHCIALMNGLTPVPSIEQRVETFRRNSFRAKMIGVHLRRGDFVLHRPDTAGNVLPTMQSVDRWLDESPDAGILLCTDDGAADPFSSRTVPYEGVIEQFARRYGARVMTTQPRSLDRHTPEAIEDALVDLWLLRLTDWFVGTVGSSFSEMAVFGRAVPAVLTAAPTLRYARQVRWLKLSGINHLLSRASQSEYGHEVPFTLILWRYKQRLKWFARRIARSMRSA